MPYFVGSRTSFVRNPKRTALRLAHLWFALVAPLLCSALPSAPLGAQQDSVFSVAQLRADVRFIQDAIAKTHPDVSHSVGPDRLGAAFRDVDAALKQPMTRDQAWRVLSTLNPVFADGHMTVTHPAVVKHTEAFLQAGGALFPFEVHVDTAGDLYIRSELGGGASALAGARIDRINGVAARDVVRQLLERTSGDSPNMRANFLARRWWFVYWKMFGAPTSFEFILAGPRGGQRLRRPASSVAPVGVRDADESDHDRQFRFELLPNNGALLTVNNFALQDKKPFFAFAERAFTAMRDQKVTTLFIDIRDNTGGDDSMWKQGLLRYIADRPYRNANTYIKKVIEGRQSETEKVGEVIRGTLDTWEQPEVDHPLHFSGKVYVLIGRWTYSSSILLANTMRDFRFGTLVGAGGYARARQSGGIQFLTLPHTGLVVIVPRFILDPPSGTPQSGLIRPDIVLPDSPFDSRALVHELDAQLRAKPRH